MNGVLIDTNLLCLLVAGTGDRAQLGVHRRLREYTVADFETVVAITAMFPSIVLCPQVLAETSNLLRYGSDRTSSLFGQVLADLCSVAEERHISAVEVVSDSDYLRLGMTDALLLLLAERGLTLLSDDLDLCRAADRRGLRLINYNYVRTGAVRLGDLSGQ